VGNRDVSVVLKELRDDVGYWVSKGRYNKVRLLRDGKQVLGDIPVGALLAAEVAGFAWAGALRTALVNVAGRLLFKVELINDAKEHLDAARNHYARGDLDEAEAETVRAVKVDSRMADGYLLLGTLAKVRGKQDEALRHFRKAKDLDPHGDVGREAETAGRRLDPGFGGGPGPDDP
jgi:tetratricopeptide (TPR) repeat protein